MIMLNTWGDRSQDAKIDEAFCLAELDRAARLGVTLFQLDDGWQSGKVPTQRQPEAALKIFGKCRLLDAQPHEIPSWTETHCRERKEIGYSYRIMVQS